MQTQAAKPEWARYQGHIYQCLKFEGDRVLLCYPGYTAPGYVNIALNGHPCLIPAMAWVGKRKVEFMSSEPVAPLPATPFKPGLQVGSRVRWGTSLAKWVVLEISGDIAKIRQTSGYAQALTWDVPMAELAELRNDHTNVLEQASRCHEKRSLLN